LKNHDYEPGIDIIENEPANVSEYKTARGVSGFIEFIGWLVVIFGVVISITGVISVPRNSGGASFIAMLPGLGTAIAGLFLVMGAQVTKATVDNADHTREILKILSRGNE